MDERNLRLLEKQLTEFTTWLSENRPYNAGALYSGMKDYIARIKSVNNRPTNCIGFVLLREYPNSIKKVGAFEPLTSGCFFDYPDIWKPVFKNETVDTSTHIVEIKVTTKP